VWISTSGSLYLYPESIPISSLNPTPQPTRGYCNRNFLISQSDGYWLEYDCNLNPRNFFGEIPFLPPLYCKFIVLVLYFLGQAYFIKKMHISPYTTFWLVKMVHSALTNNTTPIFCYRFLFFFVRVNSCLTYPTYTFGIKFYIWEYIITMLKNRF
jgi:hypothetical protein